jgi:hypothetical protein
VEEITIIGYTENLRELTDYWGVSYYDYITQYFPAAYYAPVDESGGGGSGGSGDGGGDNSNDFTPLEHEYRVDAEGFIRGREGGQYLTGYALEDAKGGATIASGVDLAFLTEAKLREYGVSEDFVSDAKLYLSPNAPRGQDALDMLNKSPLTITQEDADALDKGKFTEILNIVVNSFDAAADYADFYQLPAGAQTVIVDVAYQYGPNLETATPNFWNQGTTGDWQGAVNNLRSFGDNSGSRRNAEADLIENDMDLGLLPRN